MKKLFSIGIVAAAALVLIPTPAHAAWEYYTYGGFDSVVSAWQKCALIFSDSNYNGLFFPIVMIGAFIAITAVYTKGLMGHYATIGSWAIPTMLGMLIYLALVVPKDSLMIYDPVLNQGPAEVSGIPTGIAAFAGIMNEIQVGLTDIIDTSADPVGYQQNAGGMGFNILLNTSQTLILPPGIQGTIQQYTKDCVEFAIETGKISAAELASTTDFRTDFAKAANPAIDTVSYIMNSAGDPVSCQQAWSDPSEGILNAVDNPATWTESINDICSQSGFDPTIPAELNQCQQLVSNTSQWIWSADYDIQTEAMQTAFTTALFADLTNASPDQAIEALASRQTGSDWLSAGEAANTWVPVIMAALTTIAIGLLPLLVMFIPTPLVGKASSLIAGIFIWLTLWGVIDAIVHTFGMDIASHEAARLREFNLGTASLQFFPTFGMRVLAAFGMIRWFGLMLATVISGMLVRFGGSALARVAGGLSAAGEGSAAGKMAMDPQAHAGAEAGEAKGSGVVVSVNGMGPKNMALREIMEGSRNQFAKSTMAGAGIGSESTAMNAGAAQAMSDRGASEIYDEFKSGPGGGDARLWASAGMNKMHAVAMQGAGLDYNKALDISTVNYGKTAGDAEAFKEVASKYGGVEALEKDLAGGRLESTVGAINSYGKLTGARSFDLAAAGYFATMGTMSGATAAGQEEGMAATGRDGSGVAFKTQRELENEYAKFRMLDAVAKAHHMTPMQFLEAHHGNVSFADSKTGGITTTTMSADGKTLMSSEQMHLNHDQFGQFIAKQEALMKNMPGTRMALKPLKDIYNKGGGADLAVDRAGDGSLVSFSAKAGGTSDWENFSLARQGYDKLSEALNETKTGTRIDAGLRKTTGSDVERLSVNKGVYDHGDHLSYGTQITGESMWNAAMEGNPIFADRVFNPHLTRAMKDQEESAQAEKLAHDLAERVTKQGKVATFTEVNGRGTIKVGTPLGGVIGDSVSASGNVGIGRKNDYQQSYNIFYGEIRREQAAARNAQELMGDYQGLVKNVDESAQRPEYTFGATSVVGEPYYEAKKVMDSIREGQQTSGPVVERKAQMDGD